MNTNVERVCPDKHFSITGVSYIGEPISNTVMYVSKKVEHLIENLKDKRECLIFAEDNIEVSVELEEKHAFVFTKNPQLSYVNFVSEIDREQQLEDRKIPYRFENGYHISESAVIGKNAYIEPGCVIGHHVVIGDDAEIRVGSVIKKAIIGNRVLINEGAIIGANGFTMAKDLEGSYLRIPALGKVIIEDDVEIGVNTNIAAGSAGNTYIKKGSKIDALVHIAHDVKIGENSFIVAGSCIGGYTQLDDNGYTGINSTIKNRLHIGKNTVIGMGTVAIRDVEEGAVMAGVPAKRLR